jgi:hypothetical protein
MTLATLVPIGALLPGAIVTFALGLGLGGTAQRELDRQLRRIAVQRAVQQTAEALKAAGPVPSTPDIAEHGMPYRRAS